MSKNAAVAYDDLDVDAIVQGYFKMRQKSIRPSDIEGLIEQHKRSEIEFGKKAG